MHWVKKINYIDRYKISLTFNDKKIKVVDIEPYLDKGIFLELRDPEYFKRVKVSDDTIVWPNDADFCPDVLYQIGKEEPTKEVNLPTINRKKSTGEKKVIRYQTTYALKKRRSKESKNDSQTKNALNPPAKNLPHHP